MSRLAALAAEAPNIAGSIMGGLQAREQSDALQQRSRLAELAAQTDAMQARTAQAKTAMELDEKQRQRLFDTAPYVFQAFKDVRDQAGYERARVGLAQFGIDDLPDFSPQALTNIRDTAGAIVQAQLAAKGQDGYTLTPGAKRFDAQGRVIAEVPALPKDNTPTPTSLSRLIAERDALPATDPRRAVYDQAINREAAGSQGLAITGYDEQGRPLIQMGGPAGGAKLTEVQSKDLNYYTRGLDAARQLDALDTQLTDFRQQAAGKLPMGVGNYYRSPEFQQAKQAADSFLTAILRKDTGAAITNQEFDIYAPMFLPMPGDAPPVIEQKRRAREVALQALRSGLGTAEAVARANEQGIDATAPRPGMSGAPAAAPQNIPQPKTQAERDALQPGTQYRAPDGSIRTRQ